MTIWVLKRINEQHGYDGLDFSVKGFTSIEKAFNYLYVWYCYNAYRGNGTGLKKIIFQKFSADSEEYWGYYVSEEYGVPEKRHLWSLIPIEMDADNYGYAGRKATLAYAQERGFPAWQELFSIDNEHGIARIGF